MDIVYQLRRLAKVTVVLKDISHEDQLSWHAADEIESLRAKLAISETKLAEVSKDAERYRELMADAEAITKSPSPVKHRTRSG